MPKETVMLNIGDIVHLRIRYGFVSLTVKAQIDSFQENVHGRLAHLTVVESQIPDVPVGSQHRERVDRLWPAPQF